MLLTGRMFLFWLLNELVKLEQILSIFNQSSIYDEKLGGKLLKTDVTDRGNVVIVVVK